MTEFVAPAEIANEKPINNARALARQAWNAVVWSEPPVEYVIGGDPVVDFGKLARIGERLDTLRNAGEVPNYDDVRYASIPRSIVNLVLFEDIDGKRPVLRSCYIPVVTDDNKLEIAAGIKTLKYHFVEAYGALENRLGVAAATGLTYEKHRNGSVTTVDVSQQVGDFLAISFYGADFTPDQRDLAMEYAVRAGKSVIDSPADSREHYLRLDKSVI